MKVYTDKVLNKEYRYRVRRKKFIKLKTISLMVILMVIFVGSANMFLGLGKARGSSVKEYKVVRVVAGDTLWSIAEDNKADDVAIREVIYEISKVNNISANDLKAGMSIKIPLNLTK